MKIKRKSAVPMSLQVGDIVAYEDCAICGVHIVAAYGDRGQYGLVNLSSGDWSSVSPNLETVLSKITGGRAPCWITANDAWTLVENDQ